MFHKPNIPNTNGFSGLAQIDSSSLGIPLGGEERASGVYNDIHEIDSGHPWPSGLTSHAGHVQTVSPDGLCERQCQQRGKSKCEGYILPVLLCVISTVLLGQKSWALDTDKNQPLQIHADQVEYDGKQNLEIYTGNVVIDQGTTHVQGDKVTTYTDAQHKLIKITVYGNPAHYQTISAEKDPVFHAYGLTIIDWIREEHIQLIEQAKTEQGGKILTANQLDYYPQKKQLVSDKTHQGVHIIIPPEHPVPIQAQSNTKKEDA